MSEYTCVEKPFLTQLKSLGWEIIEHSNGEIPHDPSVSFREDFKEIVIKNIFKEKVKEINTLDDGTKWLSDSQLEDIYTELTDHPYTSLLEANKEIFKALTENIKIDINEVTGEEYPVVKLIDFENPDKNYFLAINQFRVSTPGAAKNYIIPDIVLFVNGIPLVVVECKYTSPYQSKPMEEGIRQLLRYSNQRQAAEGITEKEGEEKLFHFNQLMISTCGDEARFGTISSSYEHYLEWKDIYPPEYENFQPPFEEIRSQEKLIQGMLVPETLLDIIRHFIIFMQTKNETIKIACRYQQYRAVYKTINRLLSGKDFKERSGVIWHTQGSGKSLTMVFLIRKIRTTEKLKNYKVLVINDRTDLEEQLGETMHLTGEKIDYAENTAELKEKASTTISNILMVMIHKFLERDQHKTPEIIKDALQIAEDNLLPEYSTLGVINKSEKILILIDEAHRTQSSTLSMNMFKAFPNSTKVAFTGTPLITEKHKRRTHETFGSYIDKYKLQDAVNDGSTVQILYEGKTAETALNEKAEFDDKFEDLFRERTEEEILRIKKKYGTMGDVFEAEKRIEAIAKDIVDHYIKNIHPNRFKAQVVSSSKLAAIRYQKAIDKALQERIKLEEAKDVVNHDLINKLKFIKTAVVISSDGTNEDPKVTRVRKKAKAMNAIENFKKKFDYEKENTGIAFLIVCDMLLTGFDAPIEQVMYIDKKMVEHNLLQAIARVNRKAHGKNRGLIVDYIGIGNNLYDALKIYGGEEEKEEIHGSMKNISTEIPVLRDRYYRLLDLFKSRGIDRIQEYVEYMILDPGEQHEILEACIELLEDVHLRASFDVYYKKFLQSMDIILPNPAASDYVAPMKAFGHIQNRVRHRYKDNTTNLMGVGNKVKKLINEHLISLGVDPKIPPVELLSADFKNSLNENKTTRAKASEMEHAIRKHCKINFDEDPALYERFSEKLQKIIEKYDNDVEEKYKQMSILFEEIKEGRKEEETDGLDKTKEAPFYDLLLTKTFKEKDNISEELKTQLKDVIKEIVAAIKINIDIVDFWRKGVEQDKLKAEIDDLLIFTGIDEVINKKEQLTCDFMDLAKNKHHELVR